MAIDPRILQQIGVKDNAPVLNMFQNALTQAGNRDIQQQQLEEAKRLAPLQFQQAQQNVDINNQTLNANRNKQRLLNVHQTGQRLKPLLVAGDTQGAQQFLLDNMAAVQSRIEQGSGENVEDSMEALAKLQSGDFQGLLGDINAVEGLVNKGSKSVSQRDFETKVQLVKNDPELKTQEGKAAAIALGLEAKASSSAQERIATDQVLTDAVAKSVATIEGAKEGAKESAKLTKQLKFKPQITKAVKLAEKEATERGEVLTDLSRMTAAMPGLNNAINQLKELAPMATSTLAGRFFNAAIRETGFGATEGGTARAKYDSIIKNQILPLLKPTFGTQFTEKEGEKLEATMGDINLSPVEKIAQLEVFMEQKIRDIETAENQLNQPISNQDQGQIMTDANGNRARVFADGTFEEL